MCQAVSCILGFGKPPAQLSGHALLRLEEGHDRCLRKLSCEACRRREAADREGEQQEHNSSHPQHEAPDCEGVRGVVIGIGDGIEESGGRQNDEDCGVVEEVMAEGEGAASDELGRRVAERDPVEDGKSCHCHCRLEL